MFDTLDRLATESIDPEAEEALILKLTADFERDWPVQEALVLPPDLESWPADYRLAILLDHLDPHELSDQDRVRFLRASERLVAHQQAATLVGIGAVSASYQQLGIEDPADVRDGTTFEFRAALRWTRRFAEMELDLATDLLVRLPSVLSMLQEGRIDRRRAEVIVVGTAHLSIAHARAVADVVLVEAQFLTTGQVRARVRKACIEVDPSAMREEQQRAETERKFLTWAEPNGTMSMLLSGIDLLRGQELADRINRIARDLSGSGEARTMDQLRADIAIDLLTGTTSPTVGRVHLTVNLTDLFDDATHRAAEMAGYGPVLADIARQLVESGDGTWDWTAHDPGTGMPLTDGSTRARHHNASQSRQLRARFRTCVAPGCRMPIIGCDLDHTIAHSESGVTDAHDSAPLCRHDHCVKHQTGWTYQHLPTGDILWTGPLGTAYTTSGRDP